MRHASADEILIAELASLLREAFDAHGRRETSTLFHQHSSFTKRAQGALAQASAQAIGPGDKIGSVEHAGKSK